MASFSSLLPWPNFDRNNRHHHHQYKPKSTPIFIHEIIIIIFESKFNDIFSLEFFEYLSLIIWKIRLIIHFWNDFFFVVGDRMNVFQWGEEKGRVEDKHKFHKYSIIRASLSQIHILNFFFFFEIFIQLRNDRAMPFIRWI